MDIRLQQYYEDRQDMTSSKPWKDLMEDVQKMLDSTNRLDGVDDEKTLQFRKGEISIMRWLLNLEAVSEEAYKELKNEDIS